jgi:hypothetical protein
MLFERYNFSGDFQDLLLACIMKHPKLFLHNAGTLNSCYFSGVERTATARALFAYWRKNGRFPSEEALGQLVYDSIIRSSEAKEEDNVMAYVHKLRGMDTSDAPYVCERVVQFARERAIFLAVQKTYDFLKLGETPPGGWSKMFEDASRFDTLGLPPVKDMATALQIKPPGVLVEGVLHLASKMALGGSSKASKSFLLLALSIAVATGDKWLGLRCTRAKVLFVDFEMHEGFLQERARKIAEAMKVKLEPGWLSYQCLRGQLTPADEILPQIAQLAGKEMGLIVLDPTYRLYDAKTNENDMAKIAAMMIQIESICESTGAAVAIGTHFAKGDQSKKESIDRIGGSRAFVADPDSIITLSALKEDDTYAFEAKLRNFPRLKKFGVRWSYPVFKIDDDLDPDDLREPGDNNQKYTDHKFLLPLKESSLEKAEWKQAVVEATGMDEKTFDRRVPKLNRRGLVVEKDEAYSLSRIGRGLMSKSELSNESDA